MCVYLCAVAWLISEQQGLRKSVVSLCMAEVEGLVRKVQRGSACKSIVALLANRGGLCRRKAWLILAKAGEFKAQLFGDVTPRQSLQPHRARNEKS